MKGTYTKLEVIRTFDVYTEQLATYRIEILKDTNEASPYSANFYRIKYDEEAFAPWQRLDGMPAIHAKTEQEAIFEADGWLKDHLGLS